MIIEPCPSGTEEHRRVQPAFPIAVVITGPYRAPALGFVRSLSSRQRETDPEARAALGFFLLPEYAGDCPKFSSERRRDCPLCPDQRDVLSCVSETITNAVALLPPGVTAPRGHGWCCPGRPRVGACDGLFGTAFGFCYINHRK